MSVDIINLDIVSLVNNVEIYMLKRNVVANNKIKKVLLEILTRGILDLANSLVIMEGANILITANTMNICRQELAFQKKDLNLKLIDWKTLSMEKILKLENLKMKSKQIK